MDAVEFSGDIYKTELGYLAINSYKTTNYIETTIDGKDVAYYEYLKTQVIIEFNDSYELTKYTFYQGSSYTFDAVKNIIVEEPIDNDVYARYATFTYGTRMEENDSIARDTARYLGKYMTAEHISGIIVSGASTWYTHDLKEERLSATKIHRRVAISFGGNISGDLVINPSFSIECREHYYDGTATVIENGTGTFTPFEGMEDAFEFDSETGNITFGLSVNRYDVVLDYVIEVNANNEIVISNAKIGYAEDFMI